MKVVFLDIDGVCNHETLYSSQPVAFGHNDPASWLDPLCIARVNEICRRASAVVVISSSWRREPHTRGRVGALLAARGLIASIAGETPVLSDRWHEIRAWLDERPDVTHWVVLDDAPWEFPKDNFVRTDVAVGLTDADVERAVTILQGMGSARVNRVEARVLGGHLIDSSAPDRSG